ncbi:hypothetical protein ACHMW5_06160 (plasmid) [Azospirillum melinis]|uniref:hypothetical protein n=1 Tax=Azospirillum TaxID=191 RepID=UPI001FFE97F7|nr:hypothetical protein [Azospirillum sp. TSA6c]
MANGGQRGGQRAGWPERLGPEGGRPARAGLSEAILTFLERGVSLVVSSSDRANRPRVGRALAVQVPADAAWIGVCLDRTANAALLAAVAETGRFALAATEPSTHLSIQLIGDDATVTAADAEATALAARHVDAFAAELALIGYGDAFTRALMAHDPATLAVVRFCPSRLYDQTPGPKAGTAVPP